MKTSALRIMLVTLVLSALLVGMMPGVASALVLVKTAKNSSGSRNCRTEIYYSSSSSTSWYVSSVIAVETASTGSMNRQIYCVVYKLGVGPGNAGATTVYYRYTCPLKYVSAMSYTFSTKCTVPKWSSDWRSYVENIYYANGSGLKTTGLLPQ